MIKRVIQTIFILLLFGCVTNNEELDYVSTPNSKTSTPAKPETTSPTPEDKISPERNVRDVLLELNDETREIVNYLSNLIQERQWEELALLTDEKFYTSYITESGGTHIDYMMFMLHTGEEGTATSNSLDSINKILFNNMNNSDGKIELIGNFIYDNEEEEYFKIILLIDNGFIITRD